MPGRARRSVLGSEAPRPPPENSQQGVGEAVAQVLTREPGWRCKAPWEGGRAPGSKTELSSFPERRQEVSTLGSAPTCGHTADAQLVIKRMSLTLGSVVISRCGSTSRSGSRSGVGGEHWPFQSPWRGQDGPWQDLAGGRWP